MRAAPGLALLAMVLAGCTDTDPRVPWVPGPEPDDSPCGPAWPRVNLSLEAFPHAWPRRILVVDHPEPFRAMTSCRANEAVGYVYDAERPEQLRPSIAPRTYDEVRIIGGDDVLRLSLDLPILADGELTVDLRARANTTGEPVVRWNGTVVPSQVVERWDAAAFADARMTATWPREHLPQNLSFTVASPWNLGLEVHVSRHEGDGGGRVEDAELHVVLRDAAGRTVAEDHDGVTFDDTPRPGWDGSLDLRTAPLAPGRYTLEVAADEGFPGTNLEVQATFRH